MTKPFVIGLTGSIGMGKTTTARMFAEEGVPFWDADAAVHRLYGRGGAAAEPIGALRPEAIVEGAVDREALKRWIEQEPDALARIEAIVHPLVAQDRAGFLEGTKAPIALIDVPLLFETGLDREVDAIVVVSAPASVQKARVLARETMDEPMLKKILAKQLPDAEKRARATYVVETESLAEAHAQVRAIVADIRRTLKDA